MTEPRLRITEIFHSLQGEGLTSGIPTVFVRLTGCPLRCTYCDTEYAFKGGEWMEIHEILDKIAAYQCTYVTVTGGEPLAQANCHDLLQSLCDQGYQVSLETSGALDVSTVDSRVVKVMDLKTPSSKESAKNRLENLAFLNKHDQIKFVIADEQDYAWSKKMVQDLGLTELCHVLFSPSWHDVALTDLAQWILQDGLKVRMQIQLHKVIWGDERGR